MIIQRTDQIAGRSALELRELLRHFRGQKFDAASLLAYLPGESLDQATAFLDDLAREGYIAPVATAPTDLLLIGTPNGDWYLSVRGARLASAHLGKPFHRATAQRALDQFLERVQQVNTAPQGVLRVKRVILFGSMLDDTPTVGDVDLIVDLDHRPQADYLKHNDRRVAQALRRGRRFASSIDTVTYTWDEVMRFLQGRSPILNINWLGEGLLQVLERYQVLYPTPKTDAPSWAGIARDGAERNDHGESNERGCA